MSSRSNRFTARHIVVLGCKKFFRNSLSSTSPLLSKINLINSLSSSLKSGFNLKIVSRSKILFSEL